MANLLGTCYVSAFVGLCSRRCFLLFRGRRCLLLFRLTSLGFVSKGWCVVLAWSFSLRLLLALRRYQDIRPGMTYFGDNVASLQMALRGKAKGSEGALARELFILKARGNWRFAVAHLPSESNLLADGLSRLAQPGRSPAPPPEVLGAAEVPVPHLSSIRTMRNIFRDLPPSPAYVPRLMR